MKKRRKLIGAAVLVAAASVSSCSGGGESREARSSDVGSVSSASTEEDTMTQGDSTTAADTDVGEGTVTTTGENPSGETSEDLRELIDEMPAHDGHDHEHNENQGEIDGRTVNPGYQDQYPSDPMDNENLPETHSRSKPGLDCMDSELGDVRENLGRPVTCANVGDGPQWVEGEPYW